MALTVDIDGEGPYAIVECDRPRCYSHVAVRPLTPTDWHLYDLVCSAYDMAEAEGWHFFGIAVCHRHAPPAELQRSNTPAERYEWVQVVKGAAVGARAN